MNPSPKGHVSILILSSTSQSAQQIVRQAEMFISKLSYPIVLHAAIDATRRAIELNEFMEGDPQILVATPGRLNDFLKVAAVRARFLSLQTLILDELGTTLEAGIISISYSC